MVVGIVAIEPFWIAQCLGGEKNCSNPTWQMKLRCSTLQTKPMFPMDANVMIDTKWACHHVISNNLAYDSKVETSWQK